jgi:DNA-binding transcriptional ArsR family regulator
MQRQDQGLPGGAVSNVGPTPRRGPDATIAPPYTGFGNMLLTMRGRHALVKHQWLDYHRTMDAGVNIAAIAALVGEPTRARMLVTLMDRRARTAKELAYGAGITPQTASSHLAKLVRARLLAVERQSRHRYFRLAAASVAQAVNALIAVSPVQHRGTASEPSLDGLRLARTCYDHLAGRLGVSVTEAMVRRRVLRPRGHDYLLTASGARTLARLGVDLEETRRERRVFARQCLDWSERRTHLAGALGAALARRCVDLRWVHRVDGERTLTLTPQGRRGLRTWFGIQWKR